MSALWRARRFRFLLNIVDGLPHASHLGQARADDEEVARLTGRAPAGPRWRPSVRHHDETAVILTAIQAGIENLISLQAEKYTPTPIQPPLTAVDRIREQAARKQYRRLESILFPK
jgi:hypothetical protein